MSPMAPRSGRVLFAALFILTMLVGTTLAPVAHAQDEAPVYAGASARDAKIAVLREELRERSAERKERAEQARKLEKIHSQMLKG